MLTDYLMAMKPFYRISVLIFVTFLFACGPKPAGPPVPVELDAGEKMFWAAEQYFQEKSYQKALEQYRSYYRAYPKRPNAQAALLRIGEIGIIQNNLEAARDSLNLLITEYPAGPLVWDARIAILVTHFKEGDFQHVIQQAENIPEDRLSPPQAQRLYTLMADAFIQLGSFPDAFYYTGKALAYALEPEKAALHKKLKELVQQLDPDAMSALLDRVGNIEAKGYLLYELGLIHSKAEDYDAAIRLLSDLVETFPDHEYSRQAQTLIDELKVKLLYRIGKQPVYSRYTIGCLLPLSGPYEYYGNRALKGVELALNAFSADEMNPSITVLVKDTRSDPDRAMQAVLELQEQNVAAIIGPITTAVAAAFEAQDLKIPIITWTQRDDINIIGDYIFRNFITPKSQIETILSYVMHRLDYFRFAILFPKETYGTTYMNLFWDEVIAGGGKVVGVESYDPAQTDFADPIKKLVGLFYDVPEDLKPDPPPPPEETGDADSEQTQASEKDADPKAMVDFDAIFVPDAPKKAGLVIPQLAYYDVENVCLLGTNLWHSERLIKMAGQYAQGAILADGFFAESGSETVRNFTHRFQEAYGVQPGFIEAITYDTAMMIFQTVRRPEIGSHSILKDELLKMKNFQGVTGPTSFDETGDCRKRLYLLRLKGNRFVEVEY
jgi:ABC-type branched-subunit amino acid transport system substrate-binding protein